MQAQQGDRISAVAALDEPTRRRLYDHVARQPGPVGRDEAASAMDLPRTTAAFHLDRLVDEGLLDVVYERRSGRTGPGAGRPAKLYRRSACEVTVSLPERRYDLAGQLLATALEESARSDEPPQAVLDQCAYRFGRNLAEAREAGREAAEDVLRILEDQGYEPRVEPGAVTLENCPFHALAQEHTDLVCGMNLKLLDGLLDGLGSTGLAAELDPSPERCCVRLQSQD
ncbi:MAG TPA: helix-turn-helix domain-containing protein [Kribbella sp.]|nr:helix-turn-helix domain-containing protein [Kribbella sp.]